MTEISKNIFYVGVNDRVKHRFEALWPLPLGVSYNSYLIVDEKVALIDTVDHCHADLYLSKIRNVLGDRPIDYLIINHMEPDHSAAIRFIRQHYPQAIIVGNSKTMGMIKGFYGICEGTLEVKDRDTLSLGLHNLQFFMTPMVHWPETMMTYDLQTKTLFSGDAFGCFGALNGGVIDVEMNTDGYWDEMWRYYSNIVGKYGVPVQKALQKLSGTEISMICSTHGPVWKEQINKVVDIYDHASRYEGENGVVIAYGSMYGNTEQMAECIARELTKKGIRDVVIHNVSKSHVSYVLRDIFKYKGLIIGSPTYTNDLFPEIESLVGKLESRDIKNRLFGYFGSYTWAGAAVRHLNAFAEKMRWDVVSDPVEMKQGISDDIMAQCRRLADDMAAKLNL
ncbi:MAG: FprA family A-type flavoprotein [Bacteroidaceae bacterium]|nr:FprA family A-type flavoprotein [Bacteroidaceae bacterium]